VGVVSLSIFVYGITLWVYFSYKRLSNKTNQKQGL